MQTKLIAPKFLLIGGWLAVLASGASADAVKFYSGTTGYGPPFNGLGTVYATTALQSTATCTTSGGGTCSALQGGDMIQPSIQFATTAQNTVSITATAAGGVGNAPYSVWHDLTPNFGGLGVGTLAEGSDADQIAGSDILHLHFATSVTLTGVGTLFDAGHAPFSTGSGFQNPGDISGSNLFYLSLDTTFTASDLVTFGTANTVGGLALVGTDFYFKQDGNYQPDFYVSALTYTDNSRCVGVCAVPGPIVGAGLPGLIVACGGLLALARRRRRLVVA